MTRMTPTGGVLDGREVNKLLTILVNPKHGRAIMMLGPSYQNFAINRSNHKYIIIILVLLKLKCQIT